jgi:DNA-binding transcriptional LysR family regulator
LLSLRRVSIGDLVKWPWIVHDDRFTSGAVVSRTFQMHGLQPRIVMRAMDVNVMKAYVARGIGIALVHKMAMEDEPGDRLCRINIDHLFPSSSAMVTLRADHLLKPFAVDFIQMLLPHLTSETLAAQLAGQA